MKTLKLLLLCLLPSLALGATDNQVTVRSAGKLIADDSIDLMQQLENSPDISFTAPANTGVADTGSGLSNRLTTYSTSNAVQFDIYDAWVDLSGDLDQDGYYHHIKVGFDADVNTPTYEAVYAKIYLSYRGGPWQQLATTDLFEIYSNSENDSYEIINELDQGFYPGEYEVLIELHSLYHSGIVSQKMVQLDRNGYPITLEDLNRDQPDYVVAYVDNNGYVVAGGFSAAGLLMLGFLLLIKFSTRIKIPQSCA
jgi:hypothetical protein